MKIVEKNDHMMKDEGLGFRTVDIQNGAVHQIGEHSFLWLELATINLDGWSSPTVKS
jgi:hypothetical protein